MKKLILLAAWLIAGCVFASSVKAMDEPLISVLREDIRFSESVLPFDGGLLISNYGSDKMRPRSDEFSGYILFRKNGVNKKIVGGLHKPTGLAVKDNFLFVCDETRLVVCDLQNPDSELQVVKFEAEDKVLNDLVCDGDKLYISVTNSGRIYSLDVSNPARLGKPKLWLEIVGANGMAIGAGEMFIATIPPDYRTVTDYNVIYRVRDLQNPVAEKFFGVPGLYDGVALSDDLKTLYVSDWFTASVTAIDLVSKKTRLIYQEKGFGPADIAFADGKLFIPELVGSRIISIRLN